MTDLVKANAKIDVEIYGLNLKLKKVDSEANKAKVQMPSRLKPWKLRYLTKSWLKTLKKIKLI